MTAPNGRANGSTIANPCEQPIIVPPATIGPSTVPQFSADQIKGLIAELEGPVIFICHRSLA